MSDQSLMAEATRLTREGRLAEATALLQGRSVTEVKPAKTPKAPTAKRNRASKAAEQVSPNLFAQAFRRQTPSQSGKARTPEVPDGARWTHGTHRARAGARDYALFVPSNPAPRPALVVMLHGCTQDANDFAVGTRMNEHAEREGFLVLYPEQSRAANHNGCWNWFERANQSRTGTEPAILMDLVQRVIEENGADPVRVFVCGLSAGGAMAANLAVSHADEIAGVLVHSGLPAGVASDLPSAMRAMQGGAGEGRPGKQPVPMFVIHGDADRTVNPRNAEGLATQALGSAAVTVQSLESGEAGGRGFTRVSEAAPDGTVLCETVIVEGGGHGWSGGDRRGSHTERGIDASAEAVRFFRLARR